MRHIKTYKVFESNKIDIEDIKDILMELEDQGFIVGIKEGDSDYYNRVRGDIIITIAKRNSFFNTSEVEEYVDRVFEYIKSIGFNVKSSIVANDGFQKWRSLIDHNIPKDVKADSLLIVIEVKKKWWGWK
jgi:uncharacterized protein (UPF0335 family)